MASETKEAAPSTSQYDLTLTLSKFLDLHLMFPLLEFVDGNEFLNYKPSDIQHARLSLVKPTNMVEYAIEIFQDLNNTKEVPADMAAQQSAVYAQIEAYEKEDTTLRTFFTDYVSLNLFVCNFFFSLLFVPLF